MRHTRRELEVTRANLRLTQLERDYWREIAERLAETAHQPTGQ